MPKRIVSRSTRVLGALALALAVALPAGATSYTWTNAAGGNWSSSSNWSPAGVPSTGDAVTLPALSGAYAVTLDVNASISGLTVGTGATLQMAEDDSLQFTGRAIQNDGLIVVGPTANNSIYIGNATDVRDTLWVSGSGTIELQGGGHLMTPLPRPTLRFRMENGVGHTITGDGTTWIPLINRGLLLQAGTGSKRLTVMQYLYNYGVVSMRDGGRINARSFLANFGGTVIGHNGTLEMRFNFRADDYNYGSIDNINGGSFIADGGDLDILAGVVAGGTIEQLNGSGLVHFHDTGNPHNLVVTEGAELMLDGGTDMHIDTGSLQNHGTIYVKGYLWMNTSTSDTVATSSDGTIVLQGGALMGGFNMQLEHQTLLNAGLITGCGTIDGAFINAGTIDIDCPTLAETITSPLFVNRGRITVSRGYLRASGAASIRNVGVIDGASGGIQIDQGATIQNTGGILLAGRSNVTLGARATAATIVGGTLGASNGGYFVNSGQATLRDVTLARGATFYTGVRGVTTAAGASFVNRGTNAIQTGGVFTTLATMDYVQPEGVTLLQGGTLSIPRGVRILGALQGAGTVAGKLVNAGAVIPDVAGITVQGDYVQEKSGQLNMAVGGYTPDLFSHLTVSGAATLDGKLSMLPTGGFVPQAGHTFNVLSFGSSTGKFALVDASQDLLVDALYDAANVSLQTTAPAGVGGAGLPAALRFASRGMSLSLELPEASQVTVAAYDVTGRQVALLAQGVLSAGIHGYAMNGRGLASGMYFARATLRTGGVTQVRDARVIVLE